MRLGRYFGGLFVLSSFALVFGKVSLDPLWLYIDLPDSEKLYSEIQPYDTCRTKFLPGTYLLETDTGDKYDGNYIHINYKFSADSLYLVDKFDSTDTVYRDYRPGYAGFKFDWDNGVLGFTLAKFKYLIFAHKGPLPNHKVTVRFGYNIGCGSPTVFHTIGSVAASGIWKIDTIFIPDSVRNISDSAATVRNYYEMQVLINNASPSDTNKSSVRGVFKIDNIRLAGMRSGVINRSITVGRAVTKRSFIPSETGSVRISAFSLKGELLYCGKADVVAGKKYAVGSFIGKHAPLSPSLMKCIKIKGAGIDLLQKVR